jgi:hypothetical protein
MKKYTESYIFTIFFLLVAMFHMIMFFSELMLRNIGHAIFSGSFFVYFMWMSIGDFQNYMKHSRENV